MDKSLDFLLNDEDLEALSVSSLLFDGLEEAEPLRKRKRKKTGLEKKKTLRKRKNGREQVRRKLETRLLDELRQTCGLEKQSSKCKDLACAIEILRFRIHQLACLEQEHILLNNKLKEARI